jgi:hypothetical protein
MFVCIATISREVTNLEDHPGTWNLKSQASCALKGKCALGPFLSILVIECKHKGLNVKICSWMNKV